MMHTTAPERRRGENPCQGDLGRMVVFRRTANGMSFGSGRQAAESAGENLPYLRSRQTLGVRTETKGQGNNRGQRSGYRGILRKSRSFEPRHYVSRTGRDLAAAVEEPQAQTRGSVNS